MIRVQQEDFCITSLLNLWRKNQSHVGAIGFFLGVMRDMNLGDEVGSLTLEHYPGMTEKMLERIVHNAKEKWGIMDALIVHRVGKLYPNDQIVLVAASSEHREDALQACAFIMDYLKMRSPFWKQEETVDGRLRWLKQQDKDIFAESKWQLEK